eukprot:4259-Heterococcus_DN1.PRE.1
MTTGMHQHPYKGSGRSERVVEDTIRRVHNVHVVKHQKEPRGSSLCTTTHPHNCLYYHLQVTNGVEHHEQTIQSRQSIAY